MKYFIGCIVAALAGTGFIIVCDPTIYDDPYLLLSLYL